MAGWCANRRFSRAADRDTLLQRLTAHLVADPTLERPLTLFDPSGHAAGGDALDLSAG